MSNNEEVKFAKVTTREPKPDGSVEVTVESYYEKLANRTKTIEQQLTSSRKDLLADLAEVSAPLLKGALEVDIKIKAKPGGTFLITKSTTMSREDFGRR